MKTVVFIFASVLTLQGLAETQRTLSIIKPDGVERNLIGKIIARFEEEGLSVTSARMTQLERQQAENFYAAHKERSFYSELVDYMTSGRVLLLILEGENAIQRNREIMGATDPLKAAENTLRKLFAKNIRENTVHGSDSKESAAREICMFFALPQPSLCE